METTRKDLIQGRFAKIRRILDAIIERLTPDLVDWAPAEGMRTVSGQILEIASVEISLVPRLRDGKDLSDPEIEAIAGDCRTLEGLKRLLVDVRSETLGYLDSLSESELAEEVTYCGAWFGSYWRPTMPRAELFLNIAEHEYYHVGQLISYLWFRGDDPYKW